MDVCTSCISAKKKRERELTLSGWNITGKFCEAAEPCGRKKAASCPGHEQPPGYEAWQDWLATLDEGGEWPNSGPGTGQLTGCSVACLRFTEHKRLALVSAAGTMYRLRGFVKNCFVKFWYKEGSFWGEGMWKIPGKGYQRKKTKAMQWPQNHVAIPPRA